jgi:Na+-translocating ferredoxin:NAD+ oxidoreductase RnfG subunit
MQLFGDTRLANLGMSAKLLLTAALLTLATGYLFAIGNVTTKVGFLPEEVALKYYGNEASRQALEELQNPDETETSGVEEEEAFSFDDLDEAPGMSDEKLVPVPTFETLVSEGHFHLFGYTSIFFICGLIMLMADLPGWFRNVIIVAPFLASVLDIWSMLLTRFIGPGFSWMLIISGAVMGLSFGCVFVIAMKQLWFSKARRPAVAVMLLTLLLASTSVNPASAQIAKSGDVVSLREGLVTMLQQEGAAKMQKVTVSIDASTADSLRRIHGLEMGGSYTVYKGLSAEDVLIGSVLIVAEDGKEGPLQVLIALRPEGEIYDLGFTVFGEDKGKPAIQWSYLKQFLGLSAADPIALGSDVDGVSGATWTSTSVSHAVKKAAVIHDTFVRH